MYAQTKFTAAAFVLALGIAACSPHEDASVLSEARASVPSQFDYGWRTPESPTAEQNGNVYEYQ
jgi:hypothetical protein